MSWHQGSTAAICVLVALCVCGRPASLSAAPVAGSANFEESCDVTVWDSTAEDRSVRQVTVQCADGTITWRSPYGGLQMTFLPPGARGRHYEACFAASASYAAVRLSAELGRKLRSVFLLKASNGTVFSAEDDDRCFRFTRGGRPVTLYAEVDASMTSLAIGRLTVDYSIRRIQQSDDGSLDDMAECRPCTADELLERVCTADFAIDGRIADVTDSDSHRWTRVLVDDLEVVHQSKNFVDFLARQSLSSSSTSSSRPHNAAVDGEVPEESALTPQQQPIVRPLPPPPFTSKNGDATSAARRPSTSGPNIVVSIPAVCQVRGGDGRFLFVGNVHLKRTLRMTCAPRLEDFRLLWTDAVAEGRNPCVINAES